MCERTGYGRSFRVAGSPRANYVPEYVKEVFRGINSMKDGQADVRASSESRTEIARKVSAHFNVRAVRQAEQVVTTRQRV